MDSNYKVIISGAVMLFDVQNAFGLYDEVKKVGISN